MRAPSGTCSYPRTFCIIAKCTVFIAAVLTTTCAASLPDPPSPADKWLYPKVTTTPTYNYLDTVNASWTSNFIAPYLLLRCQHPNDNVHYAYPYNQSVSATGSALVPLDDGNAWVCHFQVSDLSTSNATPPTIISNDFNIVLQNGQNSVLWTTSQDEGENAASSATSNPATASPTTSAIGTSAISTSAVSTSSTTTTHIPFSSVASTPTIAPTSSSSSVITLPPTQSSPPPTPSSTTSGLSKSKRIATIVGATMGALLLLVIAIGLLFILRTRRSERNAVVYRSEPGEGYGSKEIPGFEVPRERWKGLEIPSARTQGYF